MATQLGTIKRIRHFPGFNVDGFNYQSPDVAAYFLTHFHADHTCGLHAGFKGPAPIYCSPITAALLTNVMGVKSELVRAVDVGSSAEVPTADGATATVTLLDANHCPGSVLLHFRHGVSGRTVLHTGDFRAARRVREDPALHNLIARHGPIGELLLDTTYCDPRWTFPDRAEVCAGMAEVVRAELEREPRTLFLVGSYSVGKERAVAAVARAAKSRAGVGWHRARTLKLTGWWDDALFLCEDDERAMHTAAETAAEAARCDGRDADAAAAPPPYRVRVTPMGGGSPHENMARTLREEMDPTTGRPRFKAVVSFRPTGWSYARGRAGDRAKIGGGAGDSRSGDRAKIALPSTEDANAETAGRFEDGDGFVRVKDEVVDGDVSARVKVESTEGMAEAGDVASGSGSGSAAALAASWRPWIENDGATRCYSVPYSEHSSFDELVAFVARVRPVKVTPTVNADTRADRDRMLKYFLPYTDLAEDKGRLDHYFRRPAALPSSAAVDRAEELDRDRDDGATRENGGGEDGDGDDAAVAPEVDPEVLAALGGTLTAAELRQQAALWEAARASNRAAQEAAQEAILGPFPLGCVALVRGGGGGFGGNCPRYVQFKDKARVEERLRALGATIVQRMNPRVTHVIVPAGGEALTEELRRHGKDPIGGEGALAEPKGDVSPQKVGFERDSGTGTETGAGAGAGTGAGSTRVGKPLAIAGTGHVTVAGTKGDAAPPPVSAPPAVVTEGWVMRHWRAKTAGTAATHSEEAIREHRARVKEERARELAERKAAEKRRREEDEAGIERRPGKERAMTRAVMDRVARAMAQRLFLVRRVDVSRGVEPGARNARPTLAGTELARAGSNPPSGGPSHAALGASPAAFGSPPEWHSDFAVFGTTGNVYECSVRARPTCTCPDFVGSRSGSSRAGSHVCKHLMWVYMRVLGVSRDDPALCQVALLQSELASMLSRPSAAQRATLAAASAREAYLRAAELPRGSEEDAPAPVRRRPTRRIPRVPDGKIADDADDVPIAEEDDEEPKCPVCFEDVEDAADRAAGSLDPSSVWWCRGGCGGNVHARCMRMWIQKSGSSTCPLCRAPWISQEPGAAADAFANDGGVLPAAVPPAASPGGTITSPRGTSYVNLRAYQAGTAAGRDLGQYNFFARRAIERREREEERRRSTGEGGG